MLDRPRIIGILNVTPDSFSDGGVLLSVDDAIAQAERFLEEGADALDVGGESTRPQGAEPVTTEEELRRVIPVIEALSRRLPAVPVSVDTTKSDGVAPAPAIDAGAVIVNDAYRGFRFDPSMAELVRVDRGWCGAHALPWNDARHGDAYQHAEYGPDVVGDVWCELAQRIAVAEQAGIAPECIAVDPGIGFSKRSEHSLAILAGLRRIAAEGFPVLGNRRFAKALCR